MGAQKSHATRRILARNIKRLRAARGWSQEELAAAARLHQVQISKIEQANNNTSVDVLQRLARALAVPVAELFEDGGR
jgi:transcriptional regulator with XRE-family HTH domain